MINIFSLSSPHFYITLALSIVNALVLCFVGYKFLQIIQVTGYKISGFFKWIYDTKAKYVSRILFLSILSFAVLMVCNCVCNALNLNAYYSYIGLIFYFYFAFIFVFKMFKSGRKTPLKYTNRMMRMLILLMIASTAVSFFVIAGSLMIHESVRFAFIALTPVLLFILVPIVFYILLPFELLIKYYYVVKAKAKLKKLEKSKKLIKVGITGSFGKTSTKFILETLLKEKYNVCTSPSSYNTTMGITKVILNNLKEEHDVLICEMGARRIKDIAKLCKIVKPNVAVVTAIGKQHMETFKTLENVAKTKFEIIDGLACDGFAVFNFADGTNEYIEGMYNNTKQEKYRTGEFEGSDLSAQNITVNSTGSEFELVDNIAGEKISCSTVLLGRHNLYNILCAARVAIKLGVSLSQIKTAISKILPIEHRLELVSSSNGVTVLDDSYNSSVTGCKMALEVLKSFTGRKFILTPGLVEMGKSSEEANVYIGAEMAKVVDEVIIVNKLNREFITKGLVDNGFDKVQISYADDLEQAKVIMSQKLKKGDVILFENDLPDNFV